MQLQSLKNKLGEIKYRKIISDQHTGKKVYFDEEPTAADIKKLLTKRLASYRETFKYLQKRDLLSSPFLEIGAEYCLASTLLKSKFELEGFASDISFYSLTKSYHFAKIFKFKKLPTLVCADAYNLPFKSSSFPFIFTYETLHHFQNPRPVLKEIYRVLAPGGTYLVGSDPIKQSFQVKLWRRPTRLRIWEKVLKAFLILPFISHIGKSETEYQIIEEAFSLRVWQNSLNLFDFVQARITIYPFGPSKLFEKNGNASWLTPGPLFGLGLFLFGGEIQAICKKSGTLQADSDHSFICPNCLAKFNKEIPLENFTCSRCKSKYTKRQNVAILTEEKLAKLTTF